MQPSTQRLLRAVLLQPSWLLAYGRVLCDLVF
jgi:hypothetical protein